MSDLWPMGAAERAVGAPPPSLAIRASVGRRIGAAVFARLVGVLVVPLSLTLRASLPMVAWGGELAPRIESVQLGFQGHYKLGKWAPARIDIECMSPSLTGQLEVSAPDGDGQPATFRGRDFTSPVSGMFRF